MIGDYLIKLKIMMKFLEFFKKTKSDDDAKNHNITQSKSWFEERYEQALIQRNAMVLVAFLCIFAVSVAVIGITRISLSKEFDPFVIQIDDTTGIAKIVNPMSITDLSAKEELSKYFMKKYLIARETYNPVDYQVYAQKVVKLLSTPNMYGNYLNYIRNPNTDPTIVYGNNKTTSLVIKSWSKLEENNYIVRFAIKENTQNGNIKNKIAVIKYAYTNMALTEEDRDINPVGFQVLGYRVDDDNS